MKYYFLAAASVFFSAAMGQTRPYPQPEFSNEIYFLEKDSMTLVRLEKNSTKMETRTKLGGFGGAEFGYYIDGARSTTRLPSGSVKSFVFYTGAAGGSNATTDSVMRAAGIDPASISQGMAGDPSSINLYKLSSDKDGRKAVLSQGGLGKKKENNKYTFSVKKIKDGYYELIIDKTLPKGEYLFTTMAYGNVDGSSNSYAFGID
jgi:hypothetical protein